MDCVAKRARTVTRASHRTSQRPTSALADMDAAEQDAAEWAQERFYTRSMGVSFQLLRSMALTMNGKMTEARALAETAMAARPYSLEVQATGAQLLILTRPAGDKGASPWARVSRLEPAVSRSIFRDKIKQGAFGEALTLRADVTPQWPEEPIKAFQLLFQNDQSRKFLMAAILTLDIAYAQAATGDVIGAKAQIDIVHAKLASVIVPETNGMPDAHSAQIMEKTKEYFASSARRVEARMAVSEKRVDDAIALIVGASLPKDSISAELLRALKLAAGPVKGKAIPDPVGFEEESDTNIRESIAGLAQNALLSAETPHNVIDYQKSRPNILGALIGGAVTMGVGLLGGIEKTEGFKSTDNPDGSIKVEYTGNSPSASVVQEMTLLRAAEIARTRGKAGFVIVSRTDYSRTTTLSRNGIPISSAPAGYKTELTIKVTDKADEARAFDAVAVIDALGPLYYEADKPAA